MDLSLVCNFGSPKLPFTSSSPKHRPSTIFRRNVNPEPKFPAITVIKAKAKVRIEDVSDDMNATAAQNMDFAPARRMVRSAFAQVQQQLDHCLFKMAPAGIRTEEWYERNSKGLEIFCKSWLPEPGVGIKGALCFCHGYGDTCTFFFEGIARQIAASGYAVYAVDHPGFGLSEGLHGYIPSFDDIVDSAIEQFTKIKGRPEVKGLPNFLMGQSMGGAVALKLHLKEQHEWDGIILVAPMCKISEDVTPPEAVVQIVTLMSKVMPKAKLFPEKDLSKLSMRDLKKRKIIAEDVTPPEALLKIMALMSKVMPNVKLFPEKDLSKLTMRDSEKRKLAEYNVISYSDQLRLKTAVELLKATRDIESQLEKVSSPLLILHGSADKVTDPLVSEFLYLKASSRDKTLKLYEEGYHCILEGEPDDRIFTALNDIVTWMDARSSVKL